MKYQKPQRDPNKVYTILRLSFEDRLPKGFSYMGIQFSPKGTLFEFTPKLDEVAAKYLGDSWVDKVSPEYKVIREVFVYFDTGVKFLKEKLDIHTLWEGFDVEQNKYVYPAEALLDYFNVLAMIASHMDFLELFKAGGGRTYYLNKLGDQTQELKIAEFENYKKMYFKEYKKVSDMTDAMNSMTSKFKKTWEETGRKKPYADKIDKVLAKLKEKDKAKVEMGLVDQARKASRPKAIRIVKWLVKYFLIIGVVFTLTFMVSQNKTFVKSVKKYQKSAIESIEKAVKGIQEATTKLDKGKSK